MHIHVRYVPYSVPKVYLSVVYMYQCNKVPRIYIYFIVQHIHLHERVCVESAKGDLLSAFITIS